MVDVIKIENLTKSYSNFEAVKGMLFSIQKGEIFGIIGPNGAGKKQRLKLLSK